jgi:hypothetical protein
MEVPQEATVAAFKQWHARFSAAHGRRPTRADVPAEFGAYRIMQAHSLPPAPPHVPALPLAAGGALLACCAAAARRGRSCAPTHRQTTVKHAPQQPRRPRRPLRPI